jgi:hypothetical protein
MVVFTVMNGNKKIAETISFRNAVDIYNKINRTHGLNSASIWKTDTNNPATQMSRVNVNISDNSIKYN